MDFRVFARKRPPEEEPSLAVALRIDESASISAYGRLDAAKQAAIGQDKEAIRELYGAENTLDITDLKQLPARLVQIIARFL